MLDINSAAGIEIQGDRLLLASLKKRFQGFMITGTSVIDGFRQLSEEELRTRVTRFLKSGNFNRENVILGLPRNEVLVHRLELPLDAEENLEQVMRFQVERLEPLEDSHSCYQYVVTGRDEVQKKLFLQVFMAPSERVDEYLDLFRRLGLYPRALRMSSLALQRIFTAHEDGFPKAGVNVVLDFGPSWAEIVVVDSDRQFHSEYLPLRGTENDAEEVLDELGVFLSRLRISQEELRKVYVSGSLDSVPREALESRLGSCEFLGRGLKLRQESHGRSLPDACITALGLAISAMTKGPYSSMNLIPPARRLIRESPNLIPTFVLITLFLILGIAVTTRSYVQTSQFASQVDSQIQTLKPEAENVLRIKNEITDKQQKLQELEDLMKGRQKVLRVLKELTEKIPEDTYLQNLSIQNDHVSLTGYADSGASVLAILLNSDCLENVSQKYILPDRRRNKEKFVFEASVRQECVR